MTSKRPIAEHQQFFVAYREQLQRATRLILTFPDPLPALVVFNEAMTALDHDTGIIRLKKTNLADDLDMSEDALEQAIHALWEAGIFYEDDYAWKVFDKLCLNPHIAWKGSPHAGDARRRQTRPLT